MVPTPDWHLSIEHILSDRSRRLVSRHVRDARKLVLTVLQLPTTDRIHQTVVESRNTVRRGVAVYRGSLIS
jgi:hypothetical protein